jgi:IclR family transcriptional regulator, positive regulator for flagellar biogenesis
LKPEAATIASVGRGLQILAAFRGDLAPVSNTELVRRTGLPKATVSRLTSMLLHLGYLRMAADRRSFEIAAGAFDIGHAYTGHSELLQHANPVLQSMADELQGSATLGVARGTDMLMIAYRASARVNIRFGPGQLLPIGLSAIGRAWLWGQSAREREALLGSIRAATPAPQWPALDAALGASFSELESTGVCAVFGAFDRQTFGVAMPMRVGWDHHRIALSCGRADPHVDLESA